MQSVRAQVQGRASFGGFLARPHAKEEINQSILACGRLYEFKKGLGSFKGLGVDIRQFRAALYENCMADSRNWSFLFWVSS